MDHSMHIKLESADDTAAKILLCAAQQISIISDAMHKTQRLDIARRLNMASGVAEVVASELLITKR